MEHRQPGLERAFGRTDCGAGNSETENGAIILFHNNSDHVLDALKIILPRLKADGYKAVSIDELVLRENFTIDNNGIQRKNKTQIWRKLCQTYKSTTKFSFRER